VIIDIYINHIKYLYPGVLPITLAENKTLQVVVNYLKITIYSGTLAVVVVHLDIYHILWYAHGLAGCYVVQQGVTQSLVELSMRMESIAPGVAIRERHPKIPTRPYRRIKKRFTEKQENLRKLVTAGCDPTTAMRQVGYSDKTIIGGRKVILESINYDALISAIKPRSILVNHKALSVIEDMLEDQQDVKRQSYGAKLAIDNARIHLQEEKASPSITFSFTTIDARQVKLDKGKRDAISTSDNK